MYLLRQRRPLVHHSKLLHLGRVALQPPVRFLQAHVGDRNLAPALRVLRHQQAQA